MTDPVDGTIAADVYIGLLVGYLAYPIPGRLLIQWNPAQQSPGHLGKIHNTTVFKS